MHGSNPAPVISDSWAAYRDLNAGYTHRNVNHSTGFLGKRTGAPTNTTEGKWLDVSFSEPLQEGTTFVISLIACSQRGAGHKVDQLTKFLYLVATTDWSECHTPSKRAPRDVDKVWPQKAGCRSGKAFELYYVRCIIPVEQKAG
jgi:hypothetical protein